MEETFFSNQPMCFGLTIKDYFQRIYEYISMQMTENRILNKIISLIISLMKQFKNGMYY